MLISSLVRSFVRSIYVSCSVSFFLVIYPAVNLLYSIAISKSSSSNIHLTYTKPRIPKPDLLAGMAVVTLTLRKPSPSSISLPSSFLFSHPSIPIPIRIPNVICLLLVRWQTVITLLVLYARVLHQLRQ